MTSHNAGHEPSPYEAYPTPRLDTQRISPEKLAELVKTKVAGRDYLVVDVRRTDFENVFIKGALNLPVDSFYPTKETVTKILSPIPTVVFHCKSCTETGRGPRAAGWYREELAKQGIDETQSCALVLDGGITAFAERYGDDESLVAKP
ncbi:SubName: Full=Uncharacterized protein {ECO:0000313/EMBL:CCA73726.1} [Serendipita indica DSM 11827]|uniref:Rhodanese domain-containing protein n=1 Tax=Serendipita indica (strain DSM 11827) TaxID=1109443 RepID=G4TQY3_SERID|nr:SubName: Full=Uncharacterized protein {ECO:0000313/EMBL:CCA73726.1} [Serendipita indica DSM 11827]CCA73726.1 hypothetical protein PIIN_07681 [Serendipita indica DSM 11827]